MGWKIYESGISPIIAEAETDVALFRVGEKAACVWYITAAAAATFEVCSLLTSHTLLVYLAISVEKVTVLRAESVSHTLCVCC